MRLQKRLISVALVVMPFWVTACSASDDPVSTENSIPLGIESRCDDPSGDVEIVGENSWDYVNQIADLNSAVVTTGRFDANSDQPTLLVGIRMYAKTNPIAELAMAGSADSAQQSATISIAPVTAREDLLYYHITFEQTSIANEPQLKVVRISAEATPTIYSAPASFEDGLFAAAISLDLLSGISAGSKWKAFSIGSMVIGGVLAMANDDCDGVLANS